MPKSDTQFKPGNPGKPKGAKNKRTKAAQAQLEASGWDPLQALIDQGLRLRELRSAEGEDTSDLRAEERDCAAKALPYVLPRLKSVEHENPELVEAMKAGGLTFIFKTDKRPGGKP